MDTSATYYDRIERYLRGELSAAEQAAFDRQLTTDPQFAAEVQLHRELEETLAGENIHRFRESLQRVDHHWKQPRRKRLRRLITPWALGIAAGFALLIGMFGHQLFSPNYDKLYTAYFEPLPIRVQMSTETADVDLLVEEAETAYSRGDYDRAIERFTRLIERDPNEQRYVLLTGISQLALSRPKAAETTLQPLLAAPGETAEAARWYLAMAALQSENIDRSRELLTQIVSSEGYRWEDASELLQRLK